MRYSLNLFLLILTAISASAQESPKPQNCRLGKTTIKAVAKNPRSLSSDGPKGPGLGKFIKFPSLEGISFAIAIPRTVFKEGEDIPLSIWLDNATDKGRSQLFCCNFTYLHYIEVFDAAGVRLLDRTEKVAQQAKLEGQDTVDVCTCSGVTYVAPNDCNVIENGTLVHDFSLPPGRYFLTLKKVLQGTPPSSVSTTVNLSQTDKNGIHFTIEANK